jgi:hypothetical protein
MTALYESKGIPRVIKNDKTEENLNQMIDLIQEFKIVVQEAVRPYRIMGCCRTSFYLFQREIFGTLD